MFKFYTIRTKLVVSTFILLVLFFVIIFIVSEVVFLNGFLKVESNDSVGDVQRVQGLLNDQISNYSIKINDWSVWDDAYKFVQDGNKEFINTNLQTSSLISIKLNFMFYMATSGAMVYEKGVDLKTGEKIKVPADLEEYLSKPNAVTVHKTIDSESHGIIKLKEGFLLISSRPIVKSNGQGPIAGTIIFGRFLDDGLLSYISGLNHSKVLIQTYDSNPLPEEYINVKDSLSNTNKYFVKVISNNEIAGFTIINDLDGHPAFILENELPRPFYVTGNSTVNYYLLIFGILSIVSFTAAMFMTNKLIIKKISKLNSDVDKIKDTNNSQDRLEVEGNDEYANLASNINKMLDHISISEGNLVKFKIAIENSSDQVVITDIDGKIIYANKATEKLTGYSIEDMANNTPRLWGRQMPKEFYVNLWDTIKNKKQPFEGELVNKNKNGKTYPVHSNIFPVIDKNKEVTFFIAVDRDISQNKKIEEALLDIQKKNVFLQESQKALANVLEDGKELESALKKAKEGVEQQVIERTAQLSKEKIKLSASISSLTLGFIMTNSENDIVIINQAARDILYASALSPLATVKEFTLTHIEDELKGAIDLKSLIEQSVTEKKVILVKELEFEKRYLKLVMTPIIEEDKAIGCVVLVEDITEVKILERSKDEFFSIASHELRTPLTAIRGNTSLIEQYYSNELKNKDLKEMIDDIHYSSVRLIEIVNDFLDMSRLELGKIEFKKEPIDLAEIAQSVVKEYQTTGSLKMLYLKVTSFTEALPQVMGDKDRIRQVLINLIGNAVKYTEKGGVTLSIDKKDGSVELLVSDTGEGIPLENQKLLFRKFQQASNNIYTRDSSQSTGLGLYISKLIAEGMGGQLELVKSEIGIGSTFSLSLPINESKETQST